MQCLMMSLMVGLLLIPHWVQARVISANGFSCSMERSLRTTCIGSFERTVSKLILKSIGHKYVQMTIYDKDHNKAEMPLSEFTYMSATGCVLIRECQDESCSTYKGMEVIDRAEKSHLLKLKADGRSVDAQALNAICPRQVGVGGREEL